MGATGSWSGGFHELLDEWNTSCGEGRTKELHLVARSDRVIRPLGSGASVRSQSTARADIQRLMVLRVVAMCRLGLAELLPRQVGNKSRHTQREAGEHVPDIVALREDGVLAPSLALRPGVAVNVRHLSSANRRT